MTYKLRDDIVLETIGGFYVLVALRSAWKECPFAMQLSPTTAAFWKAVKAGEKEDEIIKKVSASRGIDEKHVAKFLDLFIRDAKKYNYYAVYFPNGKKYNVTTTKARNDLVIEVQ